MCVAPPSVDVSAKPPRRFRRLRISASAFFAVLAVALVVLWVRSYWRTDYVRIQSSCIDFDAGYIGGTVGVEVLKWNPPANTLSFSVHFGSNHLGADELQRLDHASGFMGFVYKSPGAFLIPLWLPTFVTSLIAITFASRLKLSWRFSSPHFTHRHHAHRRRAGAGGMGGLVGYLIAERPAAWVDFWRLC